MRDLSPAPAESAVLHNAEQLLTQACMQHHGFEYWLIPTPVVTVDDLFPYVIDDRVWAQRHGFGPSVDVASSTSQRPNTRYVRNLSPRRQAAYFTAIDGAPGDPAVTVLLPNGAGAIGHSTTGCTASAEGQLYGDFAEWFRTRTLADHLSSLIRAGVVRDPAYMEAAATWSRCMSAAGYPYGSVAAARMAFLSTGRSRPDAAEVQVAIAEASCAGRTGLADTARKIDNDFRLGLPAEYQATLVTYERLWRAALTRASVTPPRSR